MTRARILSSIALLAAAVACEPKITRLPPPGPVVTALFDPTTGEIPLPNDLAISPLGLAGVPNGAQKDLLLEFVAAGGFPNDQEVAITIGLARNTIAASGSTSRAAPAGLDLTSFKASTFFVWGITAAGQGEVPLDPPTAADYAVAGDHGVLTLHHKGREPWAPGQYFAFLRGGPNGVRTSQAEPVWPSDVFFLVAQGKDMTSRENLILLQGKAGSAEAALALGQQLNTLIFGCPDPRAPCPAQGGYQPAFAAADTRFPHQELAAMTTFAVAPRVTQVDLDPGRGLVPLPVDLLRDPRPAGSCAGCGLITPLAACTLAGGTFDAAAGTCSSAAAQGFLTLDGFSTTGPILAPTNDLIDATTVTPTTVKLYDISPLLAAPPGAPILVSPATYITEPCEVTESGLSPAIALQPASASSCDATTPFRTRPLEENTEYAVVITNGVKDKTGKALGRGTVAKILLFSHPLVSQAGASQLQGIDDATAGALEVMRQKLVGPTGSSGLLAAAGIAKADVAMAYTFKTQSFLETAVQLGALPYLQPPATAAPGPVTPALGQATAAAAFAKYGVAAAAVPSSSIAEVLEMDVTTFNLRDPATGAFHADPAQAVAQTVHVLVATPSAANPNAPTCSGALAAFAPLKCAPMMVFRHGLGGGRADMLTVANGFAAQGMVTVAIDADLHGDRAFCTSGSATFALPGVGSVPQCAAGTCQAILPAGAQGDAAPLGLCTQGSTPGDGVPAFRPVSPSCFANPASCGWTGSAGIPVYSSNYLVTANFFRTRDVFRQDIIDESQLVRALALVPSGPPPTGHTLFDRMAASGVIIDPGQIYYSGQSLGAIHGTMTVATNPRISKAVLNVGGGTVVDVFTTSPAFASSVGALLAGLGISPGTSAYLQFLAVSKTILDPADPVNYAGHLKGNTLPNLLPPLGGNPDGSVPQAAKKVLTQVAFCDQVVPNPWSYVWASTLGTGPTPAAPTFGGPGDFQLFMKGTTVPGPADLASCTGGFGSFPLTPWAVEHGFLTDWVDATTTSQAQAAAAAFVVSDAQPASLTVLP
jgi:hypothetical protein